MNYARLTPWIAGLATVAAGALFACSEDPQPLGTGGSTASGTGGSNSSTNASTAPASQAVVTTGSTSTGMSAFNCDPPAEAGSIFELEDVGVFPPNDIYSMCQFRGDVMLIFNAAAI